MIKQIFILLIFSCITGKLFAQQPLPALTVKNINNKILITWVNAYAKTVTTLNIQRSYDSLKNFSTIGSVLSPQSRENGYTDDNPPYNRMYYRVFISFEGGSYIFSPAIRPLKDTTAEVISPDLYPWMAKQAIPKDTLCPLKDTASSIKDIAGGQTEKTNTAIPILHVFTTKENNVVIYLPDAAQKKYIVKFFDESDKFLFELTKLKEEYLIVEKVNFVHTGWFRFEVYENGVMIENNKFQIMKDVKKL